MRRLCRLFGFVADPWIKPLSKAIYNACLAFGRDYVDPAVNCSAGERACMGGFVHTKSIGSVRALRKR